jgi:glucosamine-6-phosphate deaminase
MKPPAREFTVNGVRVRVYEDKADMGLAAATQAAGLLREAIARRGQARIIVGTGPSQDEVIASLAGAPHLNWSAIEVFHMDEYVGMPVSHPASFRRWLKTHVADIVRPGQVHYLNADAGNPEEECRRYGNLLGAGPIDVAFLGFGENGHVAFNDPHVADFHDPLAVKTVELDTKCRLQQVGEGHFASLEETPREAVTVTCPILMGSEHVIACVPDRRKAEAVRNAIEGPLTTECPASVVFTHSRASVYLDAQSASLLRLQRSH